MVAQFRRPRFCSIRPSVYSATAAAALSATGSPPPRHLAAEPASSCSSCMATTTRQQEQGRRFEASRARWRASCALTSSMKDRARLKDRAEGIQQPDLLRSRSTAKLQRRSASPMSTETRSRQRGHGWHGHRTGWLGNDAHLGPHLGQSGEATWRPCRCRLHDNRRR